MNLLNRIGRRLATYLSKPREYSSSIGTSKPELVALSMRKGDVLLIEGTSRFSSAIKYLTQSTWSHAALCVSVGVSNESPSEPCNKKSFNENSSVDDIMLLEVDINKGVRLIPLSTYTGLHTRICRSVGLSDSEIDQVIDFARAQLGNQYDVKNIFDLARYLIQHPPVPVHLRRGMLALGSGDPTRAICSSLIAQAFQSIRYPILPRIELIDNHQPGTERRVKEILHIRHYSLFVPRDFDISPYFDIIKPNVECGFDPHNQQWADQDLTDNSVKEESQKY